jgi:hypothetical protein
MLPRTGYSSVQYHSHYVHTATQCLHSASSPSYILLYVWGQQIVLYSHSARAILSARGTVLEIWTQMFLSPTLETNGTKCALKTKKAMTLHLRASITHAIRQGHSKMRKRHGICFRPSVYKEDIPWIALLHLMDMFSTVS